MGKTTNILDLNNRLEKVEKEKVAQNNYNSLQNRPKINGNLLTGNKTGAQLGLAEAQDIGDLSALTTTDKSSCVGAINELKSGLTNLSHNGNLPSGSSISIAGWENGNVRMIVIKRSTINVVAVVLTEYWSDTGVVVCGELPEAITITKKVQSNDVVIANGTGSTIAYLVIN